MRKSTIALIVLFVSAIIAGLVLWFTAESDRTGYQSYTERWVDYGQPIHSAADVYTLDGLPYKLVSKDDSSIILRGASHDGIICTYKDSTMHLPNTFTTEQLLVSNWGRVLFLYNLFFALISCGVGVPHFLKIKLVRNVDRKIDTEKINEQKYLEEKLVPHICREGQGVVLLVDRKPAVDNYILCRTIYLLRHNILYLNKAK